MRNDQLIKDFWQAFCHAHTDVDPNIPYDVWYFGDNRELANDLYLLVLQGIKCATAALSLEYETNAQEAPKLHGYSIVTDFDGLPKCVIQTTDITIVPFNEVDAEFAATEGEGDKSLKYWQDAHRRYFSRKCHEKGLQFEPTMPVICERFRLLYPTTTL